MIEVGQGLHSPFRNSLGMRVGVPKKTPTPEKLLGPFNSKGKIAPGLTTGSACGSFPKKGKVKY